MRDRPGALGAVLAMLAVDVYQIDFGWLAGSMFELGHISIGGHVVYRHLCGNRFARLGSVIERAIGQC